MKRKTTRRYPLTLDDVQRRLAAVEVYWGRNRASNPAFGYRNDRANGMLVAFSFIESPRTPGAYREIPYCS